MAATSIGAAGYPQGLPGYLRRVTVDILEADDVTKSFAETRIFQSILAAPIPSVAASHVVVGLTTLDPATIIGGISDTVSITTVYALRNFKMVIEADEPSLDGIWDHHLALMSLPENAHLLWPQTAGERARRFVEHFEGFQVNIVGEALDRSNLSSVELSITATYRLMNGARERFATSPNP